MNQKLEKQLRALPLEPGIYLFRDAKGKLLYVGKAAVLKNRVKQYFQKNAVVNNPSKYRMIKEIAAVETVIAESEIEALLLEANYIKKFKPPYNILMKDDKSYAYIRVSTDEEWPQVMVTRQITKAGRYFGPFTGGAAAKETLKTIRRFLPFRCNQKPQGTRACFYYHLDRCPGVCVGKISKTDYRRQIRQIILFLEGKKDKLIKLLKQELRQAKREKHAEQVIKLTHQLESMADVLAHTRLITAGEKFAFDAAELARILGLKTLPRRIEGYDISNMQGRQAVGSMVVFTDGEEHRDEYRRFKMKLTPAKPNDVAMLKEMFTRRFREREPGKDSWPLPDLMIIDGGKGQLNAAVSSLKKSRLDIPVISLAKREEGIFFPGEKTPLILPRTSPALQLVQRVRDEAHRFALSYHHLLRSKKFISSR